MCDYSVKYIFSDPKLDTTTEASIQAARREYESNYLKSFKTHCMPSVGSQSNLFCHSRPFLLLCTCD